MNQFLKDILDGAALILGLAVSLNVLSNAFASQLTKRRQLRMLIMDLQSRIRTHLALMQMVSNKAEIFMSQDMPTPLQLNLPPLQKNAKNSLAIIVKHTDNILVPFPKIDPYHLANFLNSGQLAKLMGFLEDYQLYHMRLEVRLEEYKAAPDRGDVLGRFLVSAILHDSLSEKFKLFEKSLGVKQAKKQENQ